MQVETKPFGLIDVDERQQIDFPSGILGFENLRDFVLLDAPEAPFYWLQSLEEAAISFVVVDPRLFRPDYTPDIPADDLEDLGLTESDDPLVFAIVTIPEDQAAMTANLQGPLVINKKTRQGRQAISTNPRWRVRHYILEELAAVRNMAC